MTCLSRVKAENACYHRLFPLSLSMQLLKDFSYVKIHDLPSMSYFDDSKE